MEAMMNWFVNVMESEFGVQVDVEQVSYEGYGLYHEEIDESLVPSEDLMRLPDPMLFETLLYIDEQHNEWLAGIVVEEGTRTWLYVNFLRNGKLAFNKFLNEGKEE